MPLRLYKHFTVEDIHAVYFIQALEAQEQNKFERTMLRKLRQIFWENLKNVNLSSLGNKQMNRSRSLMSLPIT
jgi:hypothetical protein